MNDKFINTQEGRRINVISDIDTVIQSGGVFINGKGYLDNNNTVWIFGGSEQPKQPNKYPYFWYENHKNIVFSTPPQEVLDWFNKENISDLSVDNIIAKTKTNEKLYDEQVINDINAASSVYRPEVKDTDDPWKKCIKTAILNKQTDINRYKNKIVPYTFANVKSSLDKDTKMSVYYFGIWTELLGLNTTVILSNNGNDTINPLPGPIVYNGETGSVKELTKEELHELIDNLF